MRKNMIIFFLAVAMGLLLNDSGLWAQQKYSTQPKQVQPSRPAQESGSRVTFSKSSSAVSQPVAMVSPQNLPRALTPEQRKQAIQEARLAAGINPANLHPQPPVSVNLTPAHPVSGKSFVAIAGIKTYMTTSRFWVWDGRCRTVPLGETFMLQLETIPGKAYLLDIHAKNISGEDDLFIFRGAVDLSIRPDPGGHLLTAFRAPGRLTYIQVHPVNYGGLISIVELTRID